MLKTALIVLVSAALALGILTYFVVFYPSGSYEPVVIQGPGTIPLSSSTLPVGNGASSTPPAGTNGKPAAGTFSSEFTSPYPVSWNEGHERFSITGAALSGTELTINLSVQMGNVNECVPLNMRFVADESGTMKVPDSPINSIFTFPDSQSCNGIAGATYSEPIVFTVTTSTPSLLFTTGGSANVYFEVATTTNNGLSVTLPSHSG